MLVGSNYVQTNHACMCKRFGFGGRRQIFARWRFDTSLFLSCCRRVTCSFFFRVSPSCIPCPHKNIKGISLCKSCKIHSSISPSIRWGHPMRTMKEGMWLPFLEIFGYDLYTVKICSSSSLEIWEPHGQQQTTNICHSKYMYLNAQRASFRHMQSVLFAGLAVTIIRHLPTCIIN